MRPSALIKAVLCDIDGSLVPQGGFMDPATAAILRGIQQNGIPIGVATGKNAEYSRGMCVGAGFHWNFISAESGAQFLELVEPGPPPVWNQRGNPGAGIAHLALFRDLIKLDALLHVFYLDGVRTAFRPELKQGILTLFPSGADLSETVPWLEFFTRVVETYRLRLTLKRHGDGCIDVVPSGITKQLGVQAVCAIVGCTPEEILTVVDGVNDHELATGTTVIAVSNAHPSIRDIARRQGGFLATQPEGLGFAEGILHFARGNAFGHAESAAIRQLVLGKRPMLAA